MFNQEITEKLAKFQLSITNAKDAAILAATTVFNYDATKVDEGAALLSTAQQLNLKRETEYSEQFSATQALNVARASFSQSTYMPHLELARKLFPRDAGIRAALCLDGDRKQAYADWEHEVRQFYTNALANAAIKAKLALVNVLDADLQAGLTAVDDIVQLRAVQKKETGEAQQATEDRDQAFDVINEWMGLYYTVAKIALANSPQLLEKLGLKA